MDDPTQLYGSDDEMAAPCNRWGLRVCHDVVRIGQEIGIDEAGRGPLFGPVFAGAVVLGDGPLLDFDGLKDSKRFSSRRRLGRVAEHIMAYAKGWAVAQVSAADIDAMNIRKATHRAMHRAARECMNVCGMSVQGWEIQKPFLLVDGSDFPPVACLAADTLRVVPHMCVPKGDNTYCAIAAASILAKHARDDYIDSLVEADPTLDERYGISRNKGYGTKEHIEGLRRHGPSEYHRLSFKVKASSEAV